MKVTCESCRTVFDLPEEKEGRGGCPICAHVNNNLPTEPSDSPVSDAASEFDPIKTMIGPMGADWGGDTLRVKQAISGKKTGLSDRVTHTLHILEGDQRGGTIPLLKSQVVIGRKQGDILLNDPEVSRHHCGLLIFGDTVVIRDLGSANGTLVNERMIKEDLLMSGDTFQIGGTVFKLVTQPKP